MKITIIPFAIAMLSMETSAVNIHQENLQTLAQAQIIDPVEACVAAAQAEGVIREEQCREQGLGQACFDAAQRDRQAALDACRDVARDPEDLNCEETAIYEAQKKEIFCRRLPQGQQQPCFDDAQQ